MSCREAVVPKYTVAVKSCHEVVVLKFEVREKQRLTELERRLHNKHQRQTEDLQAAADSRLKELEQIQVSPSSLTESFLPILPSVL